MPPSGLCAEIMFSPFPLLEEKFDVSSSVTGNSLAPTLDSFPLMTVDAGGRNFLRNHDNKIDYLCLDQRGNKMDFLIKKVIRKRRKFDGGK